jgi:hypothetical protein
MSLSSEEKLRRLEKALTYGGGSHTVQDVVKCVREGSAQFWSHGDGLIVTELHSFPRMKAAHYWLISGALPDCLALDDPISQWAIREGCSVATATGRKGWGKAGAPYGWKPHMYTFVKDLCHGS